MQFDLYKNSNPSTSKTFPYLLDIQSDLMENLATRIVVPLSKDVKKPLKILNPVFEIENEKYIGLFDELSSYPKDLLEEKVGDLSESRDEILKAYDFLIQGY
ncbi:MAG: CcdB family protein [Campylobacterales bacterium]|nr:CcdB family protein [Campylobacterales bacterium]